MFSTSPPQRSAFVAQPIRPTGIVDPAVQQVLNFKRRQQQFEATFPMRRRQPGPAGPAPGRKVLSTNPGTRTSGDACDRKGMVEAARRDRLVKDERSPSPPFNPNFATKGLDEQSTDDGSGRGSDELESPGSDGVCAEALRAALMIVGDDEDGGNSQSNCSRMGSKPQKRRGSGGVPLRLTEAIPTPPLRPPVEGPPLPTHLIARAPMHPAPSMRDLVCPPVSMVPPPAAAKMQPPLGGVAKASSTMLSFPPPCSTAPRAAPPAVAPPPRSSAPGLTALLSVPPPAPAKAAPLMPPSAPSLPPSASHEEPALPPPPSHAPSCPDVLVVAGPRIPHEPCRLQVPDEYEASLALLVKFLPDNKPLKVPLDGCECEALPVTSLQPVKKRLPVW